MALGDWSEAVNSLSTSSVLRSESGGFPVPPGGGQFTYGFRAVDATPGVVARYTNLGNFDPTAYGGDISAAMRRTAPSLVTSTPIAVGFAPFVFFCMQGTDVNNPLTTAYMLGLSDANPSHIQLMKCLVSGGIPDGPPNPTVTGVLAQSTDSFPPGTWLHLRLEVVVNLDNEAVINCYASDLTANPVTLPMWVPIAGMPSIVDDNLGVTTGSLPLLAGRCGHGFQTSAIGGVALFDQIVPTAQLV
jgi:hypothetical protein